MRVLIFAACVFAGFVANIHFAIYLTVLAVLFWVFFSGYFISAPIAGEYPPAQDSSQPHSPDDT